MTEPIAYLNGDLFARAGLEAPRTWDELRGATNRFAVLQRFEFGALQFPSAPKTQPHESGMGVTRFDGAVANWMPEAWREFLAKLQRDGYALAETEWRSPEFDPGTNGRARSLITLTAHVARPA